MAGEPASIIGIIQFGFQLAGQIKKYYDDFHDAANDITSLANSLTAICGNLSELQTLLDKDQTTHGFTEHGRLNAQECCIQTKKLADKLWNFVRKSKKEFPENALVTPDDFDFGKFRLRWPILKGDVEKHMAEFRYLDLRILAVKQEYHEPGATPAERDRAAREKDSLNKAKKKAWEDLREIKEKQRAEKNAKQGRGRRRKNVQISDRPPDYRSRTPSTSSGTPSTQRRVSVDYSLPDIPDPYVYKSDVYRYYEEDDDADDDNERDTVDENGLWITEENLSEILDRIEPTLRESISLSIEEEKVKTAENEKKRQAEIDRAVTEYKEKLKEELKQSEKKALELKQSLINAFAGSGIDEEKIMEYVQQQQIAIIKENEVATLLADFTHQQPVGADADPNAGGETETADPPRTGMWKLFRLFRRSSSRTPSSRLDGSAYGSASPSPRPHGLRGRGRSVEREQDSNSSSTIYIQNELTKIFSVIVSVDGANRIATRVRLPDGWINSILKEQEKRKWWKSTSFAKSMHTYSRLDAASRKAAEEWPDDDFEPEDLILLFARPLDDKMSKKRRLLEASLLASEPWDFFHGRVLLVYKIDHGRDGGTSTYDDSASSGSRRHRRPSPPPDIGSNHSFGPDRPPSLPHSRNSSPARSTDGTKDGFGGGEKKSTNIYTLRARDADGKPRAIGIGEAFTAGERSRSEAEREREEPYYHGPLVERKRSRSSSSKRMGSYDEYPSGALTLSRRRSSSSRKRGSYDEMPPPNSPREHRLRRVKGSVYRPTYPKIHRKYLELDTLRYYYLPWEIDSNDPDYIIILKEMPVEETDILFEHTRHLRQQRLRRGPPYQPDGGGMLMLEDGSRSRDRYFQPYPAPLPPHDPFASIPAWAPQPPHDPYAPPNMPGNMHPRMLPYLPPPHNPHHGPMVHYPPPEATAWNHHRRRHDSSRASRYRGSYEDDDYYRSDDDWRSSSRTRSSSKKQDLENIEKLYEEERRMRDRAKVEAALEEAISYERDKRNRTPSASSDKGRRNSYGAPGYSEYPDDGIRVRALSDEEYRELEMGTYEPKRTRSRSRGSSRSRSWHEDGNPTVVREIVIERDVPDERGEREVEQYIERPRSVAASRRSSRSSRSSSMHRSKSESYDLAAIVEGAITRFNKKTVGTDSKENLAKKAVEMEGEKTRLRKGLKPSVAKPVKGILKTSGSDDEATKNASAEEIDDSESDIFMNASEDDDSEVDVSDDEEHAEPDSENAEASSFQLDRKMTESPVPYDNSGISANDRQADASRSPPSPVEAGGESFTLRRASNSPYVSPHAEIPVDEDFDAYAAPDVSD